MINVLFLSFCHFTRTLYYHKGLAVHVLRPAKLLQSAADIRSVIALHVNTNLSLSLPHGSTVYSSRLSGNEDEIPSFHSTSSPVVHPCRTSFQSDNEETELLKRSSLVSTRKNSHR